jgi:hypothetical protein
MNLNGPALSKSVMPSRQLFAPEEPSGVVLDPLLPALSPLEPASPLLEPALPLLLPPLPAAAVMPVVVLPLVGVVVVGLLVEPVGGVVVVEPVAPLPALPEVVEVGDVVAPIPAAPDGVPPVVGVVGTVVPVLGCPLVVVSLPPQPRAHRHGAANMSEVTEALRAFACFMTISIFPAYPDVRSERETIAIRCTDIGRHAGSV